MRRLPAPVLIFGLVAGGLVVCGGLGFATLSLFQWLLLRVGGVEFTLGQTLVLSAVAAFGSRVPASIASAAAQVFFREEDAVAPKVVDFVVGLGVWVVIVAWWTGMTWGATLAIGFAAGFVAVAIGAVFAAGAGLVFKGLK